MISLKTVNKHRVGPIPMPTLDTRKVKGADICKEPFANIYLVGKKKRGKTSVIFHLLKECIGKKTTVLIFCSTVYKDKNWIEMRKWLEKKDINTVVYTDITEEGEDQLHALMEDLKAKAEEEEEEKAMEEAEKEDMWSADAEYRMLVKVLTRDRDKEKKKKPRKEKFLTPDFICIFDDLSSKLKSLSLLIWLKTNRHYFSKTIISTQYLNDSLPESRKQMDLWLIFKGLTMKKLETVYHDCDADVSYETFCRLYKKATEKPYSFFYVDANNDDFRRNFSDKFIFKNEPDKDE